MFRFPQITIFIAPVGTVYDFFLASKNISIVEAWTWVERRDSDNNRGPTDAPSDSLVSSSCFAFLSKPTNTFWYLAMALIWMIYIVICFTKFKRQISTNTKKGISTTMMILIMVHAMSHLMSALLTISRVGRRRKMTQWGEDWANMQTILTMV